MTLKQILFIDQFARLGGGQRILLDVVEHLGKTHEVKVAFPEDGPVAETLRARDIEVLRYAMPQLTAGSKPVFQQLQYLLHVRKTAQELALIGAHADLFYVNGPRAALPAVLAAKKLGKPVFIAIHLIHSGRELSLLRWCIQQETVKQVTFCSDVAAEPFAGLGEKGQIVWNWVASEFLEKAALEKLQPDKVRIGVLGRVSKNKGQRLFLEAALPLAEQNDSVSLSIGGDSDFEDPSEMHSLQQLAQNSSASDRVTFEGSIADPVAYLDSLDIVVVPSIADESFGLVAAEAMARGKPVVATLSGGLQSIILDNETGYLVPKEVVPLREAIAKLLTHQGRRIEMGQKGRVSVAQRFSAARQLALIENLVRTAITT